jgi:hypothetical protein
MADQTPTTGARNMNANMLGALGIIILIAGLYIVAVPGAPMRGSGIGTVAILIGILLLA